MNTAYIINELSVHIDLFDNYIDHACCHVPCIYLFYLSPVSGQWSDTCYSVVRSVILVVWKITE